MSSRKMDLSDMKLAVARPRSARVDPPEETKSNVDGSTAAVDEDRGNTLEATANENVTEVDAPNPPPVEVVPVQKKPIQRGRFVGEGILALRGHRKTTSKALFNVTLDEALKERLERASFETKVKQTVIVREAIDTFLKKEGF